MQYYIMTVMKRGAGGEGGLSEEAALLLLFIHLADIISRGLLVCDTLITVFNKLTSDALIAHLLSFVIQIDHFLDVPGLCSLDSLFLFLYLILSLLHLVSESCS